MSTQHPELAVGDRVIEIEQPGIVWEVRGYDPVRRMLVLRNADATLISIGNPERYQRFSQAATAMKSPDLTSLIYELSQI